MTEGQLELSEQVKDVAHKGNYPEDGARSPACALKSHVACEHLSLEVMESCWRVRIVANSVSSGALDQNHPATPTPSEARAQTRPSPFIPLSPGISTPFPLSASSTFPLYVSVSSPTHHDARKLDRHPELACGL